MELSFSINVYAIYVESQTFLLRKSYEIFDAGIVRNYNNIVFLFVLQ